MSVSNGGGSGGGTIPGGLLRDPSAVAIAQRIAEMERRLRDIENASQLENAAIDGGRLTVTDGGDSPSPTMYVGRQYDDTYVAAPVAGPPPPQPTEPTLTAVSGGLIVAWDGLFVGADVAPMDFARVEVHASTVDGFPATLAETLRQTIETPRGTEVFVALPPELHHVRLVTRSLAGKPSVPGPQASATPLPVVTYAEFEVVKDMAENGGGGHRIYYRDTAPTVEDDGLTAASQATWFDTDDGYRPRVWDGDSWNPYQYGSSALADGAVIAAKIHTGAITADKIGANEIGTEHLRAASIEADRLSLGARTVGASRQINYNFERYIEGGFAGYSTAGPNDPPREDARFPGWTLRARTGAQAVNLAAAPTPIKQNRSARLTVTTATAQGSLVGDRLIPVREGEQWSIAATVRCDRNLLNPVVELAAALADDTTMPFVVDAPSGWQQHDLDALQPGSGIGVQTMRGKFTVPAGVTRMAPMLTVSADPDEAGGTAYTYSLDIDEVLVQPVIYATEIGDGVIRTEHIETKSIKGDLIDVAAIKGEHLSGEVVLGTTIRTPSIDAAGNPLGNVRMNDQGLVVSTPSGRPVLNAPTNGDPAVITGDATLDTASVRNGITLQSMANEIARDSGLTLGNGVSDPVTTLGLSQEWDTILLDTITPMADVDGAGAGELGTFRFDPATAVWMDVNPFGIYVITQHAGGSRGWAFAGDGSIKWVHDWADWRISSYSYDGIRAIICFQYLPSGKWYVYDSNKGWFSGLEGGDVDPVVVRRRADMGQAYTGDGTNQTRMWLIRKISGAWRYHEYKMNPVKKADGTYGGLTLTSSPATGVSDWSLTWGTTICGGAIDGHFDYNDNTERLIIAPAFRTAIRTFRLTDGAAIGSGMEDWGASATSAAARKAFAWDHTVGRFYELRPEGAIRIYSGDKWTTESSVFHAALTWYDSNTAGLASPPTLDGTHETRMGQTRSITRDRRSLLRISFPAIPQYGGSEGEVGADDPDRWRLYMYRGFKTAPLASDFKLQAEGIAPSIIAPPIDMSVAKPAPPTENNFPGATAGRIVSAAAWSGGTSQIDMRGDGWQNLIPPGTIVQWPGDTLPAGFIYADGVDRARDGETARLFGAYGTKYGPGNSTTTFGIPKVYAGDYEEGSYTGAQTSIINGLFTCEPGYNIVAAKWRRYGPVAWVSLQVKIVTSTGAIANTNFEHANRYFGTFAAALAPVEDVFLVSAVTANGQRSLMIAPSGFTYVMTTLKGMTQAPVPDFAQTVNDLITISGTWFVNPPATPKHHAIIKL